MIKLYVVLLPLGVSRACVCLKRVMDEFEQIPCIPMCYEHDR